VSKTLVSICTAGVTRAASRAENLFILIVVTGSGVKIQKTLKKIDGGKTLSK
jgi:hypothetical protein